ncbi:Aconitate hydratase mitochondrial, partial [Massospora cicadina]
YGHCIGQWDFQDVKKVKKNSITLYNFNFHGRNDGNPSIHAFVTSSKIALTRNLRFNHHENTYIVLPEFSAIIQLAVIPTSNQLQLWAQSSKWDGKNPTNLPILIKVKGRCSYNNKVADCPNLTFDNLTDTESYCTREKIKGPVDHAKTYHDTTAHEDKESFPSPLLDIN